LCDWVLDEIRCQVFIICCFAFRMLTEDLSRVPSVFETYLDAGAELAKIVHRNRELGPHLSYHEALKAAIAENPRLGS